MPEEATDLSTEASDSARPTDALPLGPMTRNTAVADRDDSEPAKHGATADAAAGGLATGVRRRLDGRPLVLVGLMGAGKTTIGRKLAHAVGLPFIDADHEIERAAGCTVAEIFARYGEAEFRTGERRVIARLLAGPQAVIATGGGAVTDAATRRLIRDRAVSVWLRCALPTLLRRVSGRTHRPLLAGGDPGDALARLHAERAPLYAEADLTVDCGDDSTDRTAARVAAALAGSRPDRRVAVILPAQSYDVVVGDGLLARAGGLLRPVLPQGRCVVVTDATVAALHLPALLASLAESGIAARSVVVPPGEASKSLAVFGRVADEILAGGMERRTAIMALGGGVIGDLAGFVAATVLRGVPFVQIPTTLLAQVDSSVGGKTGINVLAGKNLLGAFHQPVAVLADTATLATLPPRELRAGYSEIAKAGLIADPDLFAWCEHHGPAVVGGDRDAQAEAVERACRFKAGVVAADEREEEAQGGRALLNLGHTFGHALEAEGGYDGRLLHGEAVAIGCHLAFRLSAALGLCPAAEAARVTAHLRAVGLPTAIAALPFPVAAERLIGHMARDKKMRDGVLTFILAAGIGRAMTARDVPSAAVAQLLRSEGAA